MYINPQEDKQETHSGARDGMGIGACRKREANVFIAQPLYLLNIQSREWTTSFK